MKTATAFVIGARPKLARLGSEAGHLTSTVTNAAEYGITAARRRFRKGWRTAEDLADDATIAMRRHPLASAGIAFGVAFGVGTLAAWLVRRS